MKIDEQRTNYAVFAVGNMSKWLGSSDHTLLVGPGLCRWKRLCPSAGGFGVGPQGELKSQLGSLKGGKQTELEVSTNAGTPRMDGL